MTHGKKPKAIIKFISKGMKHKMKVAPSLISADFSQLKQEVENLHSIGIDTLHLDVMDGAFVPNITFGPLILRSLRPLVDMCFDTHLMIEHPDKYIKAFSDAGADIITIHFEASDDPLRDIKAIKKLNKKAGLSIQPATPVNAVSHLLSEIDLLLVMTVEPGFGGQSVITECIEKIAAAKEEAVKRGLSFIIEADGGATTQNAHLFREAGCDLLVAGTAVFRAADRAEAVRLLSL